MPVPDTAAHTSAGPRPPLADRLTPAQWLALDVAAAVLVALWVVFDPRLRHGFRFELPQAWFGVLGAAVTLPVAVRRRGWPIPVLAVVAGGARRRGRAGVGAARRPPRRSRQPLPPRSGGTGNGAATATM